MLQSFFKMVRHGGLVRAGKVRGQTKKVIPVSTGIKKKPVGRAGVRSLFNQRHALLEGDHKYKFNPQY
ncbi:40S ribosomal protein S30 [Entamoeba marina]